MPPRAAPTVARATKSTPEGHRDLPVERPGFAAERSDRFFWGREAESVRDDFRGHYGVECKAGPGGAGNTDRSPDHSDRLRRSEGCREGYPSRTRPIHRFHPVSGKHANRRACPKDRIAELLRQQGYVCGYCAVPFGSVIRHHGRMKLSACHIDHMVPLAYLNTNPTGNWIAACNFCNQVKSDHLFHSLAEARTYILERRDARGDTVEWFADVSCEQDPRRWAIKFASFLTRIDPTESVERTGKRR